MDPYEAQIMMDEMEPNERRALARTLRRRAVGGARQATSQIPGAAQQGQLMQTQAETLGRGAGLQQYRGAVERRNMAKDVANLIIAQQGDGSDEDTVGFSKPSSSVLAKFEDQANSLGSIQALQSRWNDNFTSTVPLTGSLENWIARKTSLGDEEQAEWWSDYKSMYENVQRHELFGSALTAAEKGEWRAANIDPDNSPGLVRSKLATLERLNRKIAAAAARNAINKRWEPQYVQGVMGEVLPPEAFVDLDAYIDSLKTELEGPTQLEGGGGSVQELSDEELMRRLNEIQGNSGG